MAILALVHELYVVSLILAPVLQRLPLSFRFDCHLGHLLAFFRTNTIDSSAVSKRAFVRLNGVTGRNFLLPTWRLQGFMTLT